MIKHTYYRWIILVGIVVFLLPTVGLAQYAGFKPVTDVTAFKKQFAQESTKVSTISSNFIQEKELTALTEKIISSGQFWFKRSNKVKIAYTKPFQYVLVIDGNTLLIRNENRDSQVNVRSNKLFRQINQIIVDCVQGTILESTDFTSRIFESDSIYLLELVPANKAVKDFFQRIVLRVEKRDYSVLSIEMHESTGDRTVITFMDKKLNEALPDTLFKL